MYYLCPQRLHVCHIRPLHIPTLNSKDTSLETVPPQMLPFEFGEEPANAGDMASVSCAVSKGDQPMNISWIFNGQLVNKKNDLGIVLTSINKKTSILNIEAVSGTHRGTYVCVATNRAGSANHSAVLDVNGTSLDHHLLVFVFIQFVFKIPLPIPN